MDSLGRRSGSGRSGGTVGPHHYGGGGGGSHYAAHHLPQSGSRGGSGGGGVLAGGGGGGGRLRRQRSQEWRERQYSTSEEEGGGAAAVRKRSSPTVLGNGGGRGEGGGGGSNAAAAGSVVHRSALELSGSGANSILGYSTNSERSPPPYHSGNNSSRRHNSTSHHSSSGHHSSAHLPPAGRTPPTSASDTEATATTDNPTTPFPTPPPGPTPPPLGRLAREDEEGPGRHGEPTAVSAAYASGLLLLHRQASPFPLESTNAGDPGEHLGGTAAMVYGDLHGGAGARMTLGSSRAKKGVSSSGSSSKGGSTGHHGHHSSHGSGGSGGGGGGGGSNSVGGRSRASLSASRRKKASTNSPSSSPSSSSTSSSTSDQSDTTYPDSEMAGGGGGGGAAERGGKDAPPRMRAERQGEGAGEGGIGESPPEPAPPEVPPRGPSLHHSGHHGHHGHHHGHHHHGYQSSQNSQGSGGYQGGTLRHKRGGAGIAPSAPSSAAIEGDGTESELSAGYHTANTPSANACIFLSQEYLMSGSPRAYAAKSPKSPLGGMPIGCDGVPDGVAKEFLQDPMAGIQTHRLTPQGHPYQGSGAPGSQGGQSQGLGPGAPSTPIVMPVFPVRSNSIGGGGGGGPALQSAGPSPSSALHHAPPHHAIHHPLHPHLPASAASPYSAYSPSRFHIDKRCQHRCSWKCLSIALILLCVALTAMLGYFGAVSSSRPGIDASRCIQVEEADGPAEAAAAAAHDRGGGGAMGDGGLPTQYPPPTEETFQTSTLGSSSGGTAGMQGSAGSPGRGPGSGASGLASGKDALWPVVEVRELGRPHRARIPPFRFWNAEFRNKQPAFIRMNFTLPYGAHFAVYGRRNVAPSVTQYDFVEFIRGGRVERLRRAALAFGEELERGRRSAVSPPAGSQSSTAVSSSAGSATVNVSMLQYLDTGRWFLSVYNDDLRSADVSMIVSEAEGVSTACQNDCSGRGSCYLGKCDCIDGYTGSDCSKSVCPVLCSNHGQYGGGLCHCEEGWKGSECDVPERDCEVPDCSGRGRCINGKCRCAPGWKGNACELEDCPDPECGGHGTCAGGRCHCKAGWTGHNCSSPDERVSHCLPSCSDHGAYDLEAGACVCDKFWTGPDCSRALCSLDCGPHGRCDKGGCLCDPGWSGAKCDLLPCDPRCSAHGQCKNGTCVCSQGWNGRHCTLPGCKDGCSRHGSCAVEDGEYKCACAEGWAGADCSIRLEMECADEIDNDGDGMVDCSDSECCSLHPSCSDHIMCLASNDPVEVLLRKQPPPVTASFYQRVKFLIEENSVQSYAHMDEYSESQFWNSFTPRRVSVIRGRVVTPQGLGIIGIRVSVDRDSRFGFTLTRSGGWFDVLVNGGGAVTLQFQRSPFLPLTSTVFVPWNQIVVVPPIQMSLGVRRGAQTVGVGGVDPYRELSGLRRLSLMTPTTSATPTLLQPSPPPPPLARYSRPCAAHDTEYMRPILVSTWLPDAVGGAPGENLVFAETQILQESISIPGSSLHLLYHSSQAPGYLATLLMRLTPASSSSFTFPKSLSLVHLRVEIEGSVFEKSFEADPGLEYTFAWNKRNVYKQKVYGVATARISVGYEYEGCDTIIWEPRTALMRGFDVDVSDIGGWSLDVHHHYNFHEGILQKGDGSTLHFKQFPRIVRVAMGTGTRRPLLCGSSPSPTPSSPSPTAPDPACVGPARDAKLLTPVALASGPDGSIYVGDFNLVRRLTPEGTVYTVLQLSATQVSYQYYLSVSPADGHLYVSDPERHQVVRVLSVDGPPAEPALNSEPAVGSGERCIPGDEAACGDGGPARHAKLAHPKGLAIAADKTMYIADGTNIRAVDTNGIIHTLVGHHGHHNHWRPIPCRGAIPSHQAQLQWPTALALSPLDGSLHFVDDRLVLKLTGDMKVVVVAGTPLHCPPRGTNGASESSTSSGGLANMRSSISQETRNGESNLGTEEQAWSSGMAEAVPGTHIVLGTVLSITFSPLGDLFLAQSDSRKANTIWVVDSAGNIGHFAGQRGPLGENGRGCTGGTECSSNSSSGGMGQGGPGIGLGLGGEAVLSTNAHFESISAIACSPDGILHIADRGSLHLLSLEHYLPSADEAGEFHVPHPPSREVYTFNRYGQHVATRDLPSGQRKRTFLYSKNTSFGKLSTVTDAAGNRVLFLRDYSGSVSTVESGQDRKSELRVSGGVGALVRFRERGGAAIELDYDGSTGLLTSRASDSRSGAASLYRYTGHGRLSDAVLPTGEALSLVSRLIVGDLWDRGQNDASAAPYVAGGLEVRITRDNRNPVYIRMGSNGRRLLVRGADNTASEARMYRNGSFRVRPASGSSSLSGISVDGSAGYVELTGGMTSARHPLLELALPVEAEMMPVSTSQRLRLGAMGGGSGTNVGGSSSGSAGGITSGENYMEIRYGLVGDIRGPMQTLRTDIWVNSSRVLCIELEQATSRETILDWEEAPLVTVQYDPISNLPLAWLPSPALQAVPINISYDRFNRVEGWQWGDESEHYTYERHGLLSEIHSPEDGKTEFTYNDMNLVSKITLPSGRRFTIQYDEEGGVRHITLPSGTRHAFSAQLSLGFVRVSYTPPGSSRPYLQHFGHGSGGAATSTIKCGMPHLLQTVFPGDGARVVYRYDHASRLSEVVHGDGRTQIRYGPSPSPFPTEILHSERDFEYRWDGQLLSSGLGGGDFGGGRGKDGLLVEERLDFGAKTGLSSAKFAYDRSSSGISGGSFWRVTSITGRIGGQALPEHTQAFSMRTGEPTAIAHFRVARPRPNETTLSDGTALFSRIVDAKFREVQVSLTIHRMEVFRLEFQYGSVSGMKGGSSATPGPPTTSSPSGSGKKGPLPGHRIGQTRTYTRNVGVNTYTNVKNYTYDSDGQLSGVEAQEPWGFKYDANGNLLSLTYRGNNIPMEYSPLDRIAKFGDGAYRYNVRGLVVQNAREEKFQYNARGLLSRATKRGRFDVRYFYDHKDRLAARKDNYGNVTQFFYANHERPNEVSYIYSPRDGKLMWLIYDDRGHLVFAQAHRHKYYVATDQCGTPVMVFNQYGEGIREIMRSPYGHIVYDSNPYLYLPIDFCGGLLDQVTSLVHMPGGKVYDPLIGQWMTPQWEDVLDRLAKAPTHLHLYRFNGNDPINVKKQWRLPTDHLTWLELLGYDLKSLAPQLFPENLPGIPTAALPKYDDDDDDSECRSPNLAPPFRAASGFLAHLNQYRLGTAGLAALPARAAAVRANWPRSAGSQPRLPPFRIAATEPPFGRGIVISRVPGRGGKGDDLEDGWGIKGDRAVVSSAPSANPIFRDVFTSVFNRSLLLRPALLVHSQEAFFFVKEEAWRAAEDVSQLRRLGGQLNVTLHERDAPSPSTSSSSSSEKAMDLKIHGAGAVVNVRYGTTPEREVTRLLHHAKNAAVRKAWQRELELLRAGLAGPVGGGGVGSSVAVGVGMGAGSGAAGGGVEWTPAEAEEIAKVGYASAYEGIYVHDPRRYPELAEDPFNIRFVKRSREDLGRGDHLGGGRNRRSSLDGSGALRSSPVPSNLSSATSPSLELSRTCRQWWLPWKHNSC
ncbi:teneurin-a isoform X3 [Ischnura elegans]|uniref:teneurin-a isoform X3 n=1 Tax=Ischnura elegans TaxID=197161 RepID=UPI001ED88FF1|nr:teneurin-a isoform X3 [Ischnura elegans]